MMFSLKNVVTFLQAVKLITLQVDTLLLIFSFHFVDQKTKTWKGSMQFNCFLYKLKRLGMHITMQSTTPASQKHTFPDEHAFTNVWPLTTHPSSFLTKINELINLPVRLHVCITSVTFYCLCVFDVYAFVYGCVCMHVPASLSVCCLWNCVPAFDAHIYVSGMSDPERICQRPSGALM